MNFPWFRRTGVFYVPVSLAGWILLSGSLAYAIYAFFDIDSRSHSASDTLINFVFQLLIVGAVYSLVAYLTSRLSKT
jgi:hypothetical protein